MPGKAEAEVLAGPLMIWTAVGLLPETMSWRKKWRWVVVLLSAAEASMAAVVSSSVAARRRTPAGDAMDGLRFGGERPRPGRGLKVGALRWYTLNLWWWLKIDGPVLGSV